MKGRPKLLSPPRASSSDSFGFVEDPSYRTRHGEGTCVSYGQNDPD